MRARPRTDVRKEEPEDFDREGLIESFRQASAEAGQCLIVRRNRRGKVVFDQKPMESGG